MIDEHQPFTPRLAAVREPLPAGLLPDAEGEPTSAPDSRYWARYEGHRYTYKHGEHKVQAYFTLTSSDYVGLMVELLMTVRKRQGGYAVKSARSKLGRSMKGATGKWQTSIQELLNVADLVIQTRTVTTDNEGEPLHKDDQYTLVNNFWSDSLRPGNAP